MGALLLLAAAVGVPPPAPSALRPARTSLVIGRGATVYVPVNGPLAKWAKVESDDRAIVEARKAEGGVALEARRPGDAVVSLSAGKVVKTISVSVRRWAVEFPQTLSAGVVGSPASPSAVRGAVEGAIRLGLRRAPGSTVTYTLSSAPSVGAGMTLNLPVAIRASGPASLPSAGRIVVQLRNPGGAIPPESALWYSNDPESVRSPQGLFSGRLEAGQRVRMLHHHLNASRSAMAFRVLAINDGDEPVTLAIAGGESGPDRDPVRAGLAAGASFLRSWPSGSGEIVEVPARSFVPLSFRRVLPGQTVSGLLTLSALPGKGSVEVVSDATPFYPVAPAWRPALLSSAPWREIGARPLAELLRVSTPTSVHVYPDPFRSETVDYRVGGRYGYLRIGQRAVMRQDRDGQLDGNFGVAYRYDLRLTNPTPRATAIELLFEPSAGYSAGVFDLGGEFLKTPLLRPGRRYRLKKITLRAGETRRTTLTTFPLSGSSYPATLIIRPVR